MSISTINKYLDKDSPPWECDEIQDDLLHFLTKQEKRTKKEYQWSALSVQSDKLGKKDNKCRYWLSISISDKANIILRSYVQTELFTKNVQKPNAKSEKLKRLIEARNKFYVLLPKLVQNHNGKFVAIVENNVEIDSDKDALLDRVIKKYGYVSMYFDKISVKRQIIKLGHRPHIKRK